MSKFFSIFGTIKSITPIEQVGNYHKCNIILETFPDENGYTDIYPLEAFGDKAIEKMGSLREGLQITLRFTVRSREYHGRHYTNLSFAGVDERAETERAQRATAPAPVNRTAPRKQSAPEPAPAPEFDGGDEKDLPF